MHEEEDSDDQKPNINVKAPPDALTENVGTKIWPHDEATFINCKVHNQMVANFKLWKKDKKAKFCLLVFSDDCEDDKWS